MKLKSNMTISDLKRIINDLPDDMPVIIPVISEDNCDQIFGFRFVRTAGILYCEFEEDERVLCLNAANECNIADQVRHRDVACECVLFGNRDKKESKDEI